MSNEPTSPRIPLPSLPVLLRQLNKQLGWQPYQMAEWMGKDQAEIHRWLNLKKLHKPQDATLDFIARRYQEAGLTDVTAELLKEALEFGGSGLSTALQIPDHWIRLIGEVLIHDAEFQDMIFRRWSRDLEDSDKLVAKGLRDASQVKKGHLTENQSSESIEDRWWENVSQRGEGDSS